VAFGWQFSWNFLNWWKLLNCNKHGVKASLLLARASRFGIVSYCNLMFFVEPFLGIICSTLCAGCVQKSSILGAPLNPVGAKMTAQIVQLPLKAVIMPKLQPHFGMLETDWCPSG
jgi:hypothetical protein